MNRIKDTSGTKELLKKIRLIRDKICNVNEEPETIKEDIQIEKVF